MIPVLLIMILIAIFQVPPLVRNKQSRELIGFALVWSMATIFAALVASDVTLPGLVDLLELLYSYVG